LLVNSQRQALINLLDFNSDHGLYHNSLAFPSSFERMGSRMGGRYNRTSNANYWYNLGNRTTLPSALTEKRESDLYLINFILNQINCREFKIRLKLLEHC
jgi:hypothetical protein